jgi:predicted PurR-regulated permease PerM
MDEELTRPDASSQAGRHVLAPHDGREVWTGMGVRAWTAIGVLVLVAVAGLILSAVFSALVPFIVGLLIVLLLRRPVAWLVSRHVNRTLAVALCYLAAMAASAVLLTFIIPPISAQVVKFIGQLPTFTQRSYDLWDQLVIHPRTGGIPIWLQTVAFATGGSIVGGLVGFVLALIIGFYTLVDLPRLRGEILAVVSPRSREEVLHRHKTRKQPFQGVFWGTVIGNCVLLAVFLVASSASRG